LAVLAHPKILEWRPLWTVSDETLTLTVTITIVSIVYSRPTKQRNNEYNKTAELSQRRPCDAPNIWVP